MRPIVRYSSRQFLGAVIVLLPLCNQLLTQVYGLKFHWIQNEAIA
jgi:hypothetical protein